LNIITASQAGRPPFTPSALPAPLPGMNGKCRNTPPHRLQLITEIAQPLEPFVNLEKANLPLYLESPPPCTREVNQINTAQARFFEASNLVWSGESSPIQIDGKLV
jgi:hypothetical protein